MDDIYGIYKIEIGALNMVNLKNTLWKRHLQKVPINNN